MDQAQLLSLIGSLYDKLVEDVAQRVATMNKESLAYLVDASVTESIDARVKAVVEDDFANLFRRVAAIEDKGIHANLVTEDALGDLIESWVENNMDLEDMVKEIIKDDLTFEVHVS